MKSYLLKRTSFVPLKVFTLMLMLLAGTNAFAQKTRVTGTVKDSSGAPLVGASVVVEGTTQGTTTNFTGDYVLEDVDANARLQFSYLGKIPQTVDVAGRIAIDATLQDDATEIETAVVIGYGTAKKIDLTGSIANIKASDIAGQPSANPLASIQGKVAGVQVINTGRAGQDPEIRIRGTNSVNGYAPLYIVDGLFADNINFVNPADIESMNILKDPSSLAIFGVRGANGVIIVTTKKGKAGETIVNFNSSVGYKTIQQTMDMTNAAQFRELYNEQRTIQGDSPFDYTNWGANTDWQDEIFQGAWVTANNVSITGSTDRSRFYMGVGYNYEQGNIRKEEYKKLTISLGSDYDVKDWMRVGFQFNGSRTLPPDSKNVGAAIQAAPIAPVKNKEMDLFYVMPDFQRAQVYNPMIDVITRGAHNIAQNYRGTGNIYGEIDFLQHFNFKATFSLDFAGNQNRSYAPIVWAYNPDLTGEAQKQRLGESERINQSKTIDMAAQQDYILTYTNTICAKHNLMVTAGLTTNYFEHSTLDGQRSQNYEDIVLSIPNNNPDMWWISSLDENAMANGGNQYQRFTMSYLLRAIYNYDNKYLFNASYRRDGSSVFYGTDNAWDNFYSFGAGWVVSQERFMEDAGFFDYLKIKGSWGVLGSQNTGNRNYPSYPALTKEGSAVFGDRVIPGYRYKYLVQDLGWEKTYAWEAGFEANMINNRLRLEAVYYSKVTHDLIVELEPRGGTVNSLENMGKIRNRGVELSTSWSDKIGSSGFWYSVGGNFTTIDNKVLSLGRDDADAIYSGSKSISRTVAGMPIGYFYGYKVAGVYQNYEDIKQSPKNTLATAEPGDLKFKDLDGNGSIGPEDRTIIGNPTPDFTYGFNLQIGYKGFDFSADLMGVYGNEIYRAWYNPQYATMNYPVQMMGRWHGEGTSNWEPSVDPSRSLNLMNSNYFIEDGSFFRLRNLQLGYTFNPVALNKAGIRSLRIYANVQNPWTWAYNTGYVPEIGGTAIAFGIDNGTYPMPAIYSFGLNLTF